MKLKVVLASAAVVAIAVVAFAFTSKKATQTYYYISGTDNQRLEPGHLTDVDLRDRTINSANFTDVTNWTLTQQSFNQTSDYSKFIGSISFDEESVADGGADGQLTLQEALNSVMTQYSNLSPNAMHASFTEGTAVINIVAADAKH
jgi:hypothetical protein